jgi:hypothetical protein
MMSSKKPPFDPDKLYQRALSLHHMGKLSEAESLYKTLLGFFPNQVEVLTPLGTLLCQQGRHEEGLRQLKKSLNILPNQPEALYNIGVELQKQIKLDDALACYDQAIALNPNDAESHINRGNTLRDLRQYSAALACYDRAIALKPDLASALWNKSLLKILTGDYVEGWQLYEWGWACGERGVARNFTQPQWTGKQSIVDKTLLIHAEQGLGDLIQFCRYAPMAQALGAKVVLEAPASLVSLLSTLNGDIAIVEKGKDLPELDMVCPVMSLPLAFKTTVETIPATVPYLFPNPEKQLAWRQRLGAKTRPRVGLVWSGSIANKIDLNPCASRNIPLEQLQPLLDLPIEFHMLQTEVRSDDAALLTRLPQLQVHRDELTDFAETAALVDEMDLVISVCTSVAHLAGALGQEAWVLLPYSPDYRWMLERVDSPWYPTLALIRQREIGNWSYVIAEVIRRLRARFQF